MISAALLKYVTESEGVVFMSGSLCVNVQSLDSTLKMDTATIKDLELICNNRTKKSNGSLFAYLDSTVTKMGKRSLRQQLLCPHISIETIKARQAAALELQSKPVESESLNDI